MLYYAITLTQQLIYKKRSSSSSTSIRTD